MKKIIVALLFVIGLNASASVDRAGITLSPDVQGGAHSYFLDVGVGRPGFIDGGWFFTFAPSIGNSLASLNFTNTYLDPGVELYAVPRNGAGLEFGATTIASGQFTEAAGLLQGSIFPSSYSVPVNQIAGCINCFYLGVNTGFILSGSPHTFSRVSWGTSWDRSVFGWAKFSYSSSGLKLISSALTYDSAGIFIGTSNTVPVPEPETFAMFAVGLGLMATIARLRKLRS